ncbi:phage tail protein [Pseudomonas sp. MSSRFD41]|uniref:phage tail protein n=2 Tax=Pseudomonas sp. MSSRFD41 TaxID=1310370 RepID=UPI001639B3DD|nr:phage tail protein [Pseudomonas sp. MSSRFD41]MBC2657743.1 phage tail protein [Pseudomonas sp. MSSRFD41]
MIDPNSQFFAILTAAGEAKQANADALGIPWKLTEMGVGDANGTDPIPDRAQTRLINERRRRPLNKLSVDPANPNIIVAEQIIPADEGGWWIREIGLYDAEGVLVAVANCAPSYKPLMSQGSGRTQVVRMNFIVSSAASVVLKIDPAVVLATRQYVDDSIADAVNRQDAKASVLVATTGPIQLAGTPTIDGVPVPLGSRVLVKDQAQGKDNGIYVTAEIWKRATDADSSTKVTPGLLVAVEQGTASADSLWLLSTDGPIVLGTTPLAFKNVTQGLAPINSPAFTGAPTAPTAAQFDTSKVVATTEFVQRALGNFAGQFGASTSQTLTLAQAGLLINASGTITLTLPAVTAQNIGATYQINNAGNGVVTVQAAAGQALYGVGNSTPRTFVLGSGDTITISCVGAVQWYGWGGIQMGSSAAFAASLNTSGYSKLPNGLVEQWGMVTTSPSGDIEVTYPLAWTAVPFGVHVSPTIGQDTARATSAMTLFKPATILTKFSVGAFLNNARISEAVYWRAIGKV